MYNSTFDLKVPDAEHDLLMSALYNLSPYKALAMLCTLKFTNAPAHKTPTAFPFASAALTVGYLCRQSVSP